MDESSLCSRKLKQLVLPVKGAQNTVLHDLVIIYVAVKLFWVQKKGKEMDLANMWAWFQHDVTDDGVG